MDQPNNLNDEESSLLARLEEIRAKKREMAEQERIKADIERAHAAALEEDIERSKIVVISGFEIIGDRLHFKVSDFRPDVINILRTVPSRQYNSIDETNSVKVEAWSSLMQQLVNLPRLTITFTDEEKSSIELWKPAPKYKIDIDTRGLRIEVGPRGSEYKVLEIPGQSYLREKKYFRIPFREAWRIPEQLPEDDILYSKEAEEYIHNQIEKRFKLDQIATGQVEPEEITLNGFGFKKFQNQAVAFIEANGGSGLDCLEMGLGKTPVALAVAERAISRGEIKKVLLILPAALKPNWYRELVKFTGQRPYEITGEKLNDYDIAQVLAGPHRYYMISYDTISVKSKIPGYIKFNEKGEKIEYPETEKYLWIDVIKMAGFGMAIVDEAHYIKNVGSNRSQGLRILAEHIPRWHLLTGTPLVARPADLWTPLYMVDQDMAGAYETFVTHFTGYTKASARNEKELRELLKTIMIRKTKKDVLKELPPINRIIREYELTDKAKAAYALALDGLYADLDKWDGNRQNTQVITGILAQLMRMKQICSADKVEYISDLAIQLYDETEDDALHKKVLIASQFAMTPPIVGNIASRLGDEALHFTGQQDPQERMTIVDQFQSDEEKHFLVASLKAVSEGLNITAAGSVINVDFDWVPKTHHQFEGRAYGRLSDLHSISSYYVVATGTIEQDIMALLEARLIMIDSVVDETEKARIMDASIVMEIISKLKGRKKNG